MDLKNYLKYSLTALALTLTSVSCSDYLDINKDPNAVIDAPIEQVLTSATVNLGFWAGSDMNRYGALIAQQWSGQTAGATVQTQDYEKYLITGSDVNNVWNSMYSTILSDLEIVIQKSATQNSPNYAGVAKVMKAYVFANIADTWGNAPFTEALKFTENSQPKFDDAAIIYPALITMLKEAITDLNATSTKSPGTNSTFYPGSWAASKAKWIATANTLLMRLWLHTTKVDKAKAVSEIAAIAAGPVLNNPADNFQMLFINATNSQNPIQQFEISRSNYLFANATLVDIMNAKVDPRRWRYFTSFPLHSGQFKGAKSGDPSSQLYSRTHIYLRGDTTNTATRASNGSIAFNAYTYTGTAPIRLLTAAESYFIRAEAAVLGNTQIGGLSADSLFHQGIRTSMTAAGVSTANAETYIAEQGNLTGSEAEKVKKIIEEKYVANFGVINEPWVDWRRTGYPSQIVKVGNAVVTSSSDVPRSLFYPQSEIDLNPNAPKQKINMVERVYWDK